MQVDDSVLKYQVIPPDGTASEVTYACIARLQDAHALANHLGPSAVPERGCRFCETIEMLNAAIDGIRWGSDHDVFRRVMERSAEPRVTETGYVRCPCCGNDVIASADDLLLCRDCVEAGCPWRQDSVGEWGYWSCEKEELRKRSS